MNDRSLSTRHVALGAAFLLWIVLAGHVRGMENWTNFRGPTDQGRADEAKLPVEWSEDQNVAWKTSIDGKAWSSPVIWGDRIFLTNCAARRLTPLRPLH